MRKPTIYARLSIGKTFKPTQAGNVGAEFAVEDGEVTLGKTYTVECQQGPENFYFRDNTGVLLAVHGFHIEIV